MNFRNISAWSIRNPVIPLVLFTLPVMIGVLMLPATIRVIREIAPILTG